MATSTYGTPYVQGSDLVSAYPTVSSSLATRVDEVSYAGNGLNAQTGTTYTLVAGDAGKTITLSNASPVAVTLPQDSTADLPDGAVVTFYNLGAGVVTISQGAGATLQGGPITLNQYASASVIKLSANTYGKFVTTTGMFRQIVTTLKQDTFTTTSTSYVDVTGLSATITPATTTNTVLVMVSLTLANGTDGYLSKGVILRGATIVGAGTPAGNRPAANFSAVGRGGYSQTAIFIDSPATTAATTYKVQIAAESASTATVGRGFGSDGDVSQVARVASSVTLVEVVA